MFKHKSNPNEPSMCIDTVRFLRLMPPDVDAGEQFEQGVALMLGKTTSKDTYFLTLDRASVKLLAADLMDYLQVDARNKRDTSGRLFYDE